MSMDGVMTTSPRHQPESFHSQCSSNGISPRNSKWLHQNITDMDAKVKAVVTLIEEDAGSFNRKAEMYFRKRPELMKLIEELYRAYRALAERYDFTTGELQWLQRATDKAFPSQVLHENSEDLSPKTSAYPLSPQTPKLIVLQNEFIEQNNVRAIRKLKKALIGMGDEKEIMFLKYQQTMKKLSDIEEELNCTQTSSKELCEHASEAKTEIQRLKEAISKVEVERDVAFLHQKELIARISTLESRISQIGEEGDPRAEIRSKCLENEVSRLETEKENSSLEYQTCLEKIANFEFRISLAENEAGLLHHRAQKAETEVKKLRGDLDELNEEKKSVAFQYDNCLLKLSNLESELSRAEDEMRRMSGEVVIENEKLKGAEERYATLEISNKSLKSEAMFSELGILMKEKELLEKQKECEKLHASLQNEKLQIIKAEAAILAFQNFLSQEEDGSSDLEIREVIQLLKDFEMNPQGLEEEREITLSVEDLNSVVLKLRDVKEKLEEEMGLKKGLADTLEKQIHVLKKDIKDLKDKYQSLMEKIKSLGLNPKCVGSSIQALKDENSKLKEIYKENKQEKEALSKKLDTMNQLLSKKEATEKSFQWLNEDKSALISEKSALLSQLRTITNCVEKLSENNTVLENPLYDANIEIESLNTKSENLEELYESLDNENSILFDERSRLIVSLENVKKRLESRENKFSKTENKCLVMEKENKPRLSQMRDLKASLDLEKRERSSLELSSEAHLASLEKHLNFLEEETKWSKLKFEEEVATEVNFHFEIFILRTFIQDLEMKNHSLSIECEKHAESSELRENLVSELEKENLEQQVEIELLISEIERLRADIFRVFEALGISSDNKLDDNIGNELIFMNRVIQNIENMKSSLLSYEDDKQKLLVENLILLTLLDQLISEGTEIIREKNTQNKELKSTNNELIVVKNSKHELQEINEQLNSEIKEQKQSAETLKAEIEKLYVQQRDIERDYQILEEKHYEALDENRILMKNLEDLKSEKRVLEEENSYNLMDALVFDNNCTVFNNFGREKHMEVCSLSKDLENIIIDNGSLQMEIDFLREKMKIKESENLSLQNMVKNLEKKLHEVEDINDKLRNGISEEIKIICQKEMEFCLVEDKLKSSEFLNLELCNTVKELSRKNEEIELVKQNLEKESFDLTQENKNQSKEIILLRREIDEKENELEDLKNQFRNEISAEALMLCQKDIEISLSEEELNSKNEETKLVKENLKREIIELAEENENQGKEIMFLRQANKDLSKEIDKKKNEFEDLENQFGNEISAEAVMLCQKDIEFSLSEEKLKSKIIELTEENENQSMEIQTLHEINCNLNLELKEMRSKTEVWETEASAFHFDLQISKAYEFVLENKVRELSHICKTLGNESDSKTDEMKNMKQRVDVMETEIGSFRAQLSSYAPVIDTVRETIVLLEHKVLDQPELNGDHSNESMDQKEPEKQVEEHVSAVPNRLQELLDLQTRIKSLEKVITEKKQLVVAHKSTSTEIEPVVAQEEMDPKFKKTKGEIILNFEDVKEENEQSVDKIEVLTGMHELESGALQLQSLEKRLQDLKTKTKRNKKRKMKSGDYEIMKRQLIEVEETLALAKIEPEKTEGLKLEVQMMQNMFLKLENGKKTRGKIRLLSFFRTWRRSERSRRKGFFGCCRSSTSGQLVSNSR